MSQYDRKRRLRRFKRSLDDHCPCGGFWINVNGFMAIPGKYACNKCGQPKPEKQIEPGSLEDKIQKAADFFNQRR